eukprot:4297086-Pleurochrysis_carterae.AAC.2
MTCINIDAPTQHQFDIPCQRRQSRDTVKSLDGARKWQSKVTGAMAAGVGMCAYLARSAIGSGLNLVLTVLVLTVKQSVQVLAPRPASASSFPSYIATFGTFGPTGFSSTRDNAQFGVTTCVTTKKSSGEECAICTLYL